LASTPLAAIGVAMTVKVRKQHRHRLEVETIEGPEPEPSPPEPPSVAPRSVAQGHHRGTNFDRAAWLLARPYVVVCKNHDVREFTVGANNAAAVLRQHSDSYRCHCPVIMNEHGCHAASATPADRRP
jgi:hypothetical protein